MMLDLENDRVRDRLEEKRQRYRSKLSDIEWLLSIIGDDELIQLNDPLEVARALRRLNII